MEKVKEKVEIRKVTQDFGMEIQIIKKRLNGIEGRLAKGQNLQHDNTQFLLQNIRGMQNDLGVYQQEIQMFRKFLDENKLSEKYDKWYMDTINAAMEEQRKAFEAQKLKMKGGKIDVGKPTDSKVSGTEDKKEPDGGKDSPEVKPTEGENPETSTGTPGTDQTPTPGTQPSQ